MASPVETLLRDQLEERRRKLERIASGTGGDEQIRTLLRAVDDALLRMESGAYGICEACRESIEPERLLADPLLEYCLDHLTAAQQRALEQDLDLAARVQRGLLPPPVQQVAGFEVARHYEGAGPVGGDYCDALEAAGGLHFAIGDVSGKGVAASVLMAHLHATIRTLLPLGLSLDQTVGRASALFCDSALPSHFATLVCGRALRSGEVEICNAGHVPPLVVRPGAIERVPPTGIPIGMFCESRFAVSALRLARGETMLLYTDGVNETRAPGGEEYGIERLTALLERHRDRSPAELIASCVTDLRRFRRDAPLSDDLTLLAIRRLE